MNGDLPACTPRPDLPEHNGRQEVGGCTLARSRASSTPAWATSQGSLSLIPWTDAADGPAPIRHVTITPMQPSSYDSVTVGTFPLQAEQEQLNSVVWRLAGGTGALTLLIAGGTWFAVGRVLRPVEAVRVQFAELSAHHLDRRVPVPRAGNEIARLAATMNATLDRLQSVIDRQRQFVADASHELRTPLACLRTELELALNRPDTADWPLVVDAAHNDAIRLQDLTGDLLLLARLDAEHADRQPGRPIDLTDLVRKELARRRPPTHLTVEFHTDPGPIAVHGHPALLSRVLGNLLDNAQRHAAGTIDIRLTRDAESHEAVLDVLDDGPGIPPEHHERIFERFTRLDDARARDTGGTGLGLAIAHRIAGTHHGTLTIAPTAHGAHFTLRLPAHGDTA